MVKRRRGTAMGNPEQAFGRALRSLRRRRSMSQEELGFESGYHRTYIGLLERGEKSPSLRTVFNLTAVLGVRPSTMLLRIERELRK